MKTVYVIGIGPGQENGMTLAARQAVEQCDVCFGAARMLQTVKGTKKKLIEMYRAGDVARYLKEHEDWACACVLFSGDVGFYSGAKKLLPELAAYQTELLPGVSSLAAFSAKLRIPWEKTAFGSLHGRRWNIIAQIVRNRYTFALLGGAQDLKELCDRLEYYGMEETVTLHIGERLGYPEERVLQGSAAQIRDSAFDDLLVVLAENQEPEEPAFSEIPDGAFIRGNVPMTKSGVRALALIKLGLGRESVLYDIGAGTGSVGIQAAVWLPDGAVYAVEKKEEALSLIEKNKRKFRADNVHIISGRAPQAFAELPAPTHAFIGGSTGGMRDIVSALWEKNPRTVIVAAAVTLETQAELTQLCHGPASGAEIKKEILQVGVTKAREAGAYHLMAAENPVMLVKMTLEEETDGHG